MRSTACAPLLAILLSIASACSPTPGKRIPGKNYAEDLQDGFRIEMAWIPGGRFQMGSRLTPQEIINLYNPGPNEGVRRDLFPQPSWYENEHPLHAVELDGFWMSKCEISNGQFRRFDPSHSSGEYDGHSLNGDSQPVVRVSWDQATAFCRWLSEKTGGEYVLPTEAQWEYACRAGTETPRWWGVDDGPMSRYANTLDQTAKKLWPEWPAAKTTDTFPVTAPVGSFQPNPFGLHDMLGNVYEWCGDWYSTDYYGNSPLRNPAGPETGEFKVLRGGSWGLFPSFCRAAYRGGRQPSYKKELYGFRIARIPGAGAQGE